MLTTRQAGFNRLRLSCNIPLSLLLQHNPRRLGLKPRNRRSKSPAVPQAQTLQRGNQPVPHPRPLNAPWLLSASTDAFKRNLKNANRLE
jgi:hypothetical protein